MKKNALLAIVIVFISVFVVSSALAACNHDWVYVGIGGGATNCECKEVPYCSVSSMPHSHCRIRYRFFREYQCTICGAILEGTPWVEYGDWYCDLAS